MIVMRASIRTNSNHALQRSSILGVIRLGNKFRKSCLTISNSNVHNIAPPPGPYSRGTPTARQAHIDWSACHSLQQHLETCHSTHEPSPRIHAHSMPCSWRIIELSVSNCQASYLEGVILATFTAAFYQHTIEGNISYCLGHSWHA